eukprot:1678809-Rhodomonas_salina.3
MLVEESQRKRGAAVRVAGSRRRRSGCSRVLRAQPGPAATEDAEGRSVKGGAQGRGVGSSATASAVPLGPAAHTHTHTFHVSARVTLDNTSQYGSIRSQRANKADSESDSESSHCPCSTPVRATPGRAALDDRIAHR